MKPRAHNRPALLAMILAALACYANAPRLAATLLVGDAVNLAAAADSMTRDTLRQRLDSLPQGSPQAEQLAQRLHEGEQSSAIAESLPSIPHFVAPSAPVPQVEQTVGQPPRIAKAVVADHWALQDGVILTTSLPPPPDTGCLAGPRAASDAATPTAQSRAPPRAL